MPAGAQFPPGMRAPTLIAVLSLAGLVHCASGAGPDARSAAPSPEAPDAGAADAGFASSDAGTPSGWVVAYREDFESLAVPSASFAPDPHPADGPYADDGVYFARQGIVPPAAFRATVPFGQSAWLTAESYTRSAGAALSDRFAIVEDPADPKNHALRIASPAHTDATVVRPSQPLPDKYRISLRVGFADFGDGKPGGLNGYRGGETPEPWLTGNADEQNGFYWLAILDSTPRPHNNVWIHQHRKVVMDSDNNVPPWMEMWDGAAFHLDGQHPLMMFALDGAADPHELYGPPFLSYSAGAWQPSGAIRAVDAYLPGEWYRASIERDGTRYTLQVSGKFRYGGDTTYRASIDARANCIWHYDRTPEEMDARCANSRHAQALGAQYPYWPADATFPDWFMFGDPHENFYMGSVLYDDVQLEVRR